MAGWRGKETDPGIHRAAFRVGRPVVESPHSRERDRGGAHGAGFECDIEIAVGQPLTAADATTSFPRTITQPIGTSPDFPAFSAAFSAKSMKDGAVIPRFSAHDPPKCKRFGDHHAPYQYLRARSDAKTASTFADRALVRTLLRGRLQQKWMPVLRENCALDKRRARHRHASPPRRRCRRARSEFIHAPR